MPVPFKFVTSTVLLLAMCGLAGCGGGSSNQGAGLTTSAVLDGAAAGGSDEGIGIQNDNPLARPIHVAWTAARAEKCGFNFDAAALRSRFIAAETQAGGHGQPMAAVEKAYDTTYQQVRSNLTGQRDYCTDRKAAEVRASLTRHLAGDFTPNFPKARPAVAQCGGLFQATCDSGEPREFSARDFWQQQRDARAGARNTN